MSRRVETENERKGLADCPFCGCHDAVLVTNEMDGVPELEEDYFVRCNHCFAQGPNRLDEKQAIAEWNGEKPTAKILEVDALDLAKRITMQVHIKYTRQLQWRIKLACWLIIVANWAAGFGGVGFEDSEDDKEAQTPT